MSQSYIITTDGRTLQATPSRLMSMVKAGAIPTERTFKEKRGAFTHLAFESVNESSFFLLNLLGVRA